MSDGEQLEGTLNVDGKDFPAMNRGRGVFTITPEKGMEREVAFTTKDGKKVTAKLPKPKEQGVVLSVGKDGAEWVISTQTVGNLVSDSLAVMVMNEGTVVRVYELSSILDSKVDLRSSSVTTQPNESKISMALAAPDVQKIQDFKHEYQTFHGSPSVQ